MDGWEGDEVREGDGLTGAAVDASKLIDLIIFDSFWVCGLLVTY